MCGRWYKRRTAVTDIARYTILYVLESGGVGGHVPTIGLSVFKFLCFILASDACFFCCAKEREKDIVFISRIITPKHIKRRRLRFGLGLLLSDRPNLSYILPTSISPTALFVLINYPLDTKKIQKTGRPGESILSLFSRICKMKKHNRGGGGSSMIFFHPRGVVERSWGRCDQQ